MPHNPDDVGLDPSRSIAETVAMPELDAEELLDFRPFVQFPAPTNATGQAKRFYESGRLHELLEDVECGSFESQLVLTWFWKESPSWSSFPSQAEFTKYARYRLRRFVKESRKLADAGTVVCRMFDQALKNEVSFSQVMTAITLLAPTEPMPRDIVEVHGKRAYIDLTKRSDFPKILTVDAGLLPMMRAFWPFEWSRESETVVKQVSVGGGVIHSIPMIWLAFWAQHSTGTVKDDLMAVVPRNCDWLDLRADNLVVETESVHDGVPEIPPDEEDQENLGD
jgi:hypothetical protein